MRRQVIVLLFILLLALPAVAQWPDSFIGDHMTPPQNADVQMWMSVIHSPYGTGVRTGTRFYFGNLAFDICNDSEVAILSLNSTAARHCIGEQCHFYFSQPINFPPYTLEWNSDAQSYITENVVKWGSNVVVLTVLNAEDSISQLQLGTMQLTDGLMVWDETRSKFIYVIEPLTATELLPQPRRGGRRVIGKGKETHEE